MDRKQLLGLTGSTVLGLGALMPFGEGLNTWQRLVYEITGGLYLVMAGLCAVLSLRRQYRDMCVAGLVMLVLLVAVACLAPLGAHTAPGQLRYIALLVGAGCILAASYEAYTASSLGASMARLFRRGKTARDDTAERLQNHLLPLLTRIKTSRQQHQNGTAAGWCPLHQCPMQLRVQAGQLWWSHLLPNGEWCRGEDGGKKSV